MSLVAETHIPPKSSQMSKLDNWPQMKILIIQQQCSHLPVLDIFPKAMDARGSRSRALPVIEEPGSQRTARGRGESGFKFISLFYIKNEALIMGAQNIHSRARNLS